MFRNTEMCHEEINRCARVDLADRRPGAHPERKRSPCVAVELRIRRQRVLTSSRPSKCFRLRLNMSCTGQAVLHCEAAASHRTINLADEAILSHRSACGCGSSMARLSARISARSVKARQRKLKVVVRG